MNSPWRRPQGPGWCAAKSTTSSTAGFLPASRFFSQYQSKRDGRNSCRVTLLAKSQASTRTSPLFAAWYSHQTPRFNVASACSNRCPASLRIVTVTFVTITSSLASTQTRPLSHSMRSMVSLPVTLRLLNSSNRNQTWEVRFAVDFPSPFKNNGDLFGLCCVFLIASAAEDDLIMPLRMQLTCKALTCATEKIKPALGRVSLFDRREEHVTR